MKATRHEVFLLPQFIPAAMKYLHTVGTQYQTALPNGLLVVTTDKQSDFDKYVEALVAYCTQYTTHPVTVVSTPCNINTYKD